MRSESESNHLDIKGHIATCPAGKKAVGGGGFPIVVSGSSGIVNTIAVNGTAGGNDSWSVHAFETISDDVTTWRLRVEVICLSVS